MSTDSAKQKKSNIQRQRQIDRDPFGSWAERCQRQIRTAQRSQKSREKYGQMTTHGITSSVRDLLSGGFGALRFEVAGKLVAGAAKLDMSKRHSDFQSFENIRFTLRKQDREHCA